jgi:hypothetical protein
MRRLFDNPMDKKKHRLYLISPSGKEYEIGFLSPCRDGFVLGTRQIEGIETSHLTVISKKGTLSSHITRQDTTHRREYFPPLTKKHIVEKFQSLKAEDSFCELSTRQLSEEVFYVTQRLLDWLDSLLQALYEERVTTKEVIHILNFERLIKNLPTLIKEISESPYSFFGLCKARDILSDNSKIAGITNSGMLIVPSKNGLHNINLSMITDFDFEPTLEKQHVSSPFIEITRAIGIPQYMEEIKNKKFLEKLLSKDMSELHQQSTDNHQDDSS